MYMTAFYYLLVKFNFWLQNVGYTHKEKHLTADAVLMWTGFTVLISFIATQLHRYSACIHCNDLHNWKCAWNVQLKVSGQIAFTSSQTWGNFSCLIILKACIKRNTLVVNARVPLTACAIHETSMIISKRASFKEDHVEKDTYKSNGSYFKTDLNFNNP